VDVCWYIHPMMSPHRVAVARCVRRRRGVCGWACAGGLARHRGVGRTHGDERSLQHRRSGRDAHRGAVGRGVACTSLWSLMSHRTVTVTRPASVCMYRAEPRPLTTHCGANLELRQVVDPVRQRRGRRTLGLRLELRLQILTPPPPLVELGAHHDEEEQKQPQHAAGADGADDEDPQWPRRHVLQQRRGGCRRRYHHHLGGPKRRWRRHPDQRGLRGWCARTSCSLRAVQGPPWSLGCLRCWQAVGQRNPSRARKLPRRETSSIVGSVPRAYECAAAWGGAGCGSSGILATAISSA
jgi:hypothetical protein